MSALSDAILGLSPSGYWRLGETSGTTAVDSSGNGLSGTYSGAYSLGVGSLVASDTDDKAFGASGTGYVSIPNSALTVLDAPFSFFGIFKRNTTSGDQVIFHKGQHTSSGNQGLVAVFASGSDDISVSWFNGSWRNVVFSNVVSGTNSASLCFIYNGSTELKLIVDGTSIYTKTLPVELVGSSYPLLIGALASGSYLYFLNGVADECFWVPRELTDAEAAYVHAIAIDATPKYRIQSGSALSFNSGSIFALSGSSDFSPQTSRRAVNIGAGSSVVFNTNQRHFSIFSGSEILPKAGFKFSFASESALNFSVQSTLKSSTEIYGASSFSSSSGSLFCSNTKIKTASMPMMKGGYNAMTCAVISCRSIVRADYSALSKSVFSSWASSSPVFVSNLARLASYAIGAFSFVSPKASVVKPAEVHHYGSSSISFSGIGAKQSAFSLSGHAALQFYSNYTTTPLPDTEFEYVAFVKTAPISVFARQ